MIITKKVLPRRTLLRGAGAALALPLLEAMAPPLTAQTAGPANPVRRLGFIYMPMGATIDQWTPQGEGRIAQLSPSLSALAPVMDQLTVITNMELSNAYSAGNHATANSAFLSAAKAKMTEGSDYELATTVDQVAARQIGLPGLSATPCATMPGSVSSATTR